VSAQELRDNTDFRKLLDEGKEKGMLTYEQVSEALAQNEDLDPEQMEDMLQILHDEGIQVVDKSRTLSAGRSVRSAEPGMTEEEVVVAEGPIDDSVRMWLREIGRTPLLRFEDEVRLAKRIEAGEKAKARSKEIAEDPEAAEHFGEEHIRLDRLMEIGEKAKETLVRANLRLVVAIAKKYSGRGMAFPDLIQEGNIGLIRAVEKFDYRKGYKFSTYATWWIRQAITRAIADHSRTIRIPVHMVETINRLMKVSSQLQQELGREPTMDELAKEMGLSVDRVTEISRIAPEPLSLETPIGEEDDSHLADFIQDHESISPDEAANNLILREQITSILNTLTDRERDVIKLRFGLDDGYPRTLEEVGKRFNVTRERIRQIEAKALKKLRHKDRSRKLRDYLD
jgi:RNA polymerase primary sigma factor